MRPHPFITEERALPDSATTVPARLAREVDRRHRALAHFRRLTDRRSPARAPFAPYEPYPPPAAIIPGDLWSARALAGPTLDETHPPIPEET